MPALKIQHVVSFSSEDKVHKAENLLKPETYRKWKCATPGEKQASVILQLEKASVISSIDIGNENSAFIEVLVARSSDPAPDFHVLLVASSFMTPMDARQGTNLNRVRMFGSDKLSQSFVKEKWDRIKVVCTQPFNKSVQYGLAFIKLHSPEDVDSKAGTATLGSFQLKNDDDEEANPSVGSWFAKRKEKAALQSATSPAAIKAASYAATTLRSAEEKMFKPSKLADSKKEATGNTEDTSSSPVHQKARAPQRPATPETKQKPAPKQKPVPEKAKPKETERPQAPKAQKRKAKPAKKFEELMKGVVFVLSGFQNPARSQIRDKALEMGAKYKADWDRSCTHLVCAFVNTPKYGQVVAAGGKIVTKEWILDSYREKRLHPWHSYKLGSYNRPVTPEPEEDSEGDEADDDQDLPASRGPRQGKDGGGVTPGKRPPPITKTGSSPEKRARRMPDDDTRDPVPGRTSREEHQGGDSDFDAATDVDDDEEMDTEEEIELAKQRSASAKSSRPAGGGAARSGRESSETGRGDDPRPPDLPELPDFFAGKTFLLYGDFPEEEKRALTRYIVGHDGDLKDDMDACVRFVVTKSDWNDYFDEALCENESLVFLRPRWVNRCHEAGRRVPHQPFVVACPES